MGKLEALIFDVDGTLAETERDGHRLAFNRAFADAGLPWDWSVGLYGSLLEVAGGKERLRYYLDRYRPDFQPPTELTSFIAQIHRAKTHHFKALMETAVIPPRPGVRRLIEAARRAGVRLAIATTSSPDNAIALLQSALAPEAPQWFEVIAAGDMVPTKKPAPDIYVYALEQLALSPSQCLVIEDSHQGLIAASQAGLKTVITVNDYTRRQNHRAATLVVNHLGEPNLPWEVLQGDAQDAYFFTLDLANRLLNRSA